MVYTLIDVVQAAAMLYTILVIVRVILSWVNPAPGNPLVAFVYRITEPVMGPIRNLLPAMGGIDFSPLLVLVGIQLAERLAVRLLLGLAG